MNYLFKSERLGFRNWIEEDQPKMIAISADTKVMEFFPSVADPNQTISFIERMQSMQADKGYCYFAVDVLETGEFIGFIGLCDQDDGNEFAPYTDIGWRLGASFWKMGYATEGAKACLDYAFNTIGLTEVLSIAISVNESSLNVMKKIGMKKHLDFVHSKYKEDERLKSCVCYRIENKP